MPSHWEDFITHASLVDCLGKNNTSFSQEKAEFPITNLERLSSCCYVCVTIENILVLTFFENTLILLVSPGQEFVPPQINIHHAITHT